MLSCPAECSLCPKRVLFLHLLGSQGSCKMMEAGLTLEGTRVREAFRAGGIHPTPGVSGASRGRSPVVMVSGVTAL